MGGSPGNAWNHLEVFEWSGTVPGMKKLLSPVIVALAFTGASWAQPETAKDTGGQSPVRTGETYKFGFINPKSDPPDTSYKVLRILKDPWIEVEKSYSSIVYDGTTRTARTDSIRLVFVLNLTTVETIFPWREPVIPQKESK